MIGHLHATAERYASIHSESDHRFQDMSLGFIKRMRVFFVSMYGEGEECS